MIVFPNAKINIGLNVVAKRPDGYHTIESCFYPVPWYDALEVIEEDRFNFTSTGIDIPGKTNSCVQAYALLKADFDLPPVHIHLHKNIPIGAGLGGGSADGAFMLKLLNDKFGLQLTGSKLTEYAGKLGSDCPFFIRNKPVFVKGTGNVFADITLDLQGFYLVVVYPQVPVSTQQAYQNLVPAKPQLNLKETLESVPVTGWPDKIGNAFEKNAPREVRQLKQQLYQAGAIYASMSGSGSAVYGLFKTQPELTFSFPHIVEALARN